jgi:cytochrome c556
MHIYWKVWTKPALTKDQAEQFAADVRRMLARLREERMEMEKLARKINKAIG